jgi:hypothetical protein
MKDGLWVDVRDNIADLYFAVLSSYTPCNYLNNRAGIIKRLWCPGIDSKELIPPAYEDPAGRYDNPIPTQFLAPTDWGLTIPALGYHLLRSISV